jgi:hypothetical protein
MPMQLSDKLAIYPGSAFKSLDNAYLYRVLIELDNVGQEI